MFVVFMVFKRIGSFCLDFGSFELSWKKFKEVEIIMLERFFERFRDCMERERGLGGFS